jgi:hypothetical protein
MRGQDRLFRKHIAGIAPSTVCCSEFLSRDRDHYLVPGGIGRAVQLHDLQEDPAL